MSNYFGDELVTGILTRLPVKHILRFMSVCKSWKSLISSSHFISSQLRYSEKNNTQIIVRQISITSKSPSRLFYLDDHCVNNHYESLLLNLGLKDPPEIVGSVNGLICFAHTQGNNSEFIIFNPEIGSFLVVPSPTPLWSTTVIRGFGFDDTTVDYTIFITKSESHVYLYSLNFNYWKYIDCQISRYSSHSSSCSAVFLNGRFHWVAEDYQDEPPFIMFFDIKNERFGRILFQEWLRGSLGIIKGFGESPVGVIQYLGGNLNHVWLMEQNGSWVKIAEKVSVGESRPADLSEHDTEKVLGFRNKDELLISFYNRGGVVSQNIKNKEVRTLITREEEGFFSFEVHSYVPSLVSLNRI